MWRRFFNELSIHLYWLKYDLIRKWRLDSPFGILGIIILVSGLFLLILIGEGVARYFRILLPWVAGAKVSDVYWTSLFFGLKFSIAFILFSGALIIFLVLKTQQRR